MHNRKTKHKLRLVFDESGATAIFFALTLSMLCGFVALAFDLGHMFMVRTELQRTADAAALAGVTGFIPYTGSAPNQTPAWASGVTKAHTLISNAANLADNQQFTTAEGTVDYGYWLLAPPTGYDQTLPQARPTTPAYLPEPALRVTVSRQVNLSFAPVIGVTNPRTVSAAAIAILPEGYQTTGMPPIAVSWNTVYNPVPGSEQAQIDVLEQDVKPQSNQGIAGWFNVNAGNSVPSVKIDVPLTADPNVNQGLYLVPGTKAKLTDYITQGSTIVMPVVQDVSKMEWMPILEWAAFKVDLLSANSMTGHFVTSWLDNNVLPAPYTNATIGVVAGTPKLVSP
jgi:Flp pilus assembly protein TadG